MKDSMTENIKKWEEGLQTSKTVAFTLAEVLITLGVIGVVAAVTLPTVIKKYQVKTTVSKLKKIYSILDQSARRAIDENGTPDLWGRADGNNFDSSKIIYDKISPHLKIIKNCGSENGCFFEGMYKKISGGDWHNVDETTSSLRLYKFILADGTSVYIQNRTSDCSEGANDGTTPQAKSICAFFGVDINGKRKPNQFGKDLFIFQLTKYGVIPRGGSYSDASASSSFSENCLINSSSSNGWACAAWVVFNENMDYLDCKDLSWSGKHTCK